jgi:hypothetical protein
MERAGSDIMVANLQAVFEGVSHEDVVVAINIFSTHKARVECERLREDYGPGKTCDFTQLSRMCLQDIVTGSFVTENVEACDKPALIGMIPEEDPGDQLLLIDAAKLRMQPLQALLYSYGYVDLLGRGREELLAQWAIIKLAHEVPEPMRRRSADAVMCMLGVDAFTHNEDLALYHKFLRYLHVDQTQRVTHQSQLHIVSIGGLVHSLVHADADGQKHIGALNVYKHYPQVSHGRYCNFDAPHYIPIIEMVRTQ